MSEYQYIAFRAIDKPVSHQNLAFMREQSTRAEITPWTFDNEYTFGDFHGDAVEMLRRGYDFFVHFADFGVRKLMIRLPRSLPARAAAKRFFDAEAVVLKNDPKGPGAILLLEQSYEPGEYDEDLYDIATFVDQILPIRAELMDGDLRPLFIAYLAAMFDMNHDYTADKAPPIPAGLTELTSAQKALVTFTGLDKWLLAAAAEQSPDLGRPQAKPDYTDWLREQSEDDKVNWLNRILTGAEVSVPNEVLAAYAVQRPPNEWPWVKATLTLKQLQRDAEKLQKDNSQKRAAAAVKARVNRLTAMATDPEKTLRDVDQLVAERPSNYYEKAAKLLAELHEALAGTRKKDLPYRHAEKIRSTHSNLRVLISALKKRNLIPQRANRS